MWQGDTKVVRDKCDTIPGFQTQTPHDLVRDWTSASVSASTLHDRCNVILTSTCLFPKQWVCTLLTKISKPFSLLRYRISDLHLLQLLIRSLSVLWDEYFAQYFSSNTNTGGSFLLIFHACSLIFNCSLQTFILHLAFRKITSRQIKSALIPGYEVWKVTKIIYGPVKQLGHIFAQ